MAYATVEDVQAGMIHQMSEAEQSVCETLLDRVAVLIDAYNADASADAKNVVSAQAVARAIGDGDSGIPTGATQGSMSALGYSQSWTMGSGASVGELYLTRKELKILGAGNAIGSYSPTEELVRGPII